MAATNAVATAATSPGRRLHQLPAPTLEQRVAGLEAYIADSDPTAALKDTNGNMNLQWPPS